MSSWMNRTAIPSVTMARGDDDVDESHRHYECDDGERVSDCYLSIF